MKSNVKKILLFVYVIIMTVVCFAFSAGALVQGDYEYIILDDGTVKITDYVGASVTVNIPSEIDGKKVTVIGFMAFNDCSCIENITIPDTVEIIESYVFNGTGYYNKASNWSNGALYIGKHLVNGENVSGSYTVKSGTLTIAGAAFQYCDSLTNLTIPSGVKSIGETAFWGTGLTEITIPDSVKYIGEQAFYYSSDIKKITVNSNNTAYSSDSTGALYDKNKTVLIKYPSANTKTSYTIPDTVKEIRGRAFESAFNLKSITFGNKLEKIGDQVFFDCRNIETVTIPASVTELDHTAFDKCTGMKNIIVDQNNKNYSNDKFGVLFDKNKETLLSYPKGNERTSYSVPDTVKTISYEAFCDASKLQSLNISENIEKIEGRAFSDCVALSSISIPDKVLDINNSVFYGSEYYNCLDNWENGVLYVGKHLICANNDIEGTCEIKDGTLTIAQTAFNSCENIEKIIIPDSVAHIGEMAFYSCKLLQSINIPKRITKIYNYTFAYCESLKSISLSNNITYIGQLAFDNCGMLKSVDIPDSVTVIGAAAFRRCTNLESVTGGNGVTELEIAAFRDCINLKTVKLGNKIKSAGDSLFAECKSLESIVIPDSINTIGPSMFYNCKSLKSVSIPASVEYIEESAFYGCESLSKLTVPNADCSIYDSEDTFHKNITIRGIKNSTAEEYAKRYGRKFESYCPHSYKNVTTKATLTANGKTETKCTACGNVSKTTTIYSPKTFTLSATSYTYDGKVKTPKVTVKDSKGKTLTKNTDYTLSSETGRKNPGEYTVTITFKGNYSGTKKINFTIKPKAVTGIKATQTTTSVKLTWSKVTGVTGYRVYKYNSKTKKYEKLKDVKTNSLTISKLKAGTKYKYKVRAYKKDNVTIWADYSKIFETATKPATPTLKVKSTSKGKASLSWSNVSGESGYMVYFSMNKTSGFKKLGETKANVNVATVTSLTSGKTYYFRVRAYVKTASGTVYGGYKTVAVKVK